MLTEVLEKGFEEALREVGYPLYETCADYRTNECER